jgi:hypothetical protein
MGSVSSVTRDFRESDRPLEGLGALRQPRDDFFPASIIHSPSSLWSCAATDGPGKSSRSCSEIDQRARRIRHLSGPRRKAVITLSTVNSARRGMQV